VTDASLTNCIQILDFSQKQNYNSLRNYDFNDHKKIISQQPFWKDIYVHKLAYKFNFEK